MAKTLKTREILARNCIRFREAGDLTQDGIIERAKRAGYKLDQKSISRVEHGINATLNTLETIAAGLSVQPWQLLLPENITQLELPSNPKEHQICETIKKLNEEGLTALLASAKFIASDPDYAIPSQSKQRK